VHLDSYHMHIEEPDMIRPVLVAGERLGYVHVGESNRGHLGSGQVRLAELFRGLELGGYDGIVTFEAFTRSRVSPELMGALALWRDTWDDPIELAERALATMRELQRAAQDASRACPGRLGTPPPGAPD
jgi:D-psicose/D-tagatose/L-ribulose 3-epimerase